MTSIIMLAIFSFVGLYIMQTISGQAIAAFNGMTPITQKYSLGDSINNAGGVSTGEVYYVDGNKVVNGDGDTWANAFNSLVSALAVSHADIGDSVQRGWADRNTIYFKGDLLEESLTKLAQKTDVIGVGSMNQYKKAGLQGTHVIEAAATNHYMGCRLINIHFRDDGATVNWTLPADQNGIEFIGCTFQRNAGGTGAISSIGNHDMRIVDCIFRPDTSGGMFTTAIDIGDNVLTNMVIKGCWIKAGIGIAIHATPAYINCRIEDCKIWATTLTIDDNSDDWAIIGNKLISAAADGGATAPGCIDGNIKLAVDNYLAGDDSNGPWPNLDAHS